jgi:cysteinyl-tRNA synthetase
VSLRLYDTMSRTIRPFEPIVPGQVSIYLCGPTVQDPPHIGHMRSAVAYDILRRWLLASGFSVLLARNVTDIDDKIIDKAARSGEPWFVVAQRNTRAFQEAYDALGVLPPSVEPRATGHVPEMITLMQRLIDAGHAYADGADVWFAVTSLPGYGRLSGRRLDDARLEAFDAADAGDVVPDADGADAVASGKRDPRDFALWKSAKPGEPSWPTPWGEGRPGWHLECSAMATRYLGPTFDIHGGGVDLVFPHHENEVAQSVGAGDGFARFWVHHQLVNVGDTKMSKSLGNGLLVSELLHRVRPVVLRYALGAAHYRSIIDWSEAGLAEAEAAYGRIEGFVRRAVERVGPVAPARRDGAAWDAFAAALDDDLAVPAALAVLHTTVRAGNEALAEALKPGAAGHDAHVRLSALLATVRAMADVLGLDPLDAQWQSGGSAANALESVVDRLVGVVLEERAQARRRKDWATADRIRDALTDAGITVEDTPAGPRWQLS